MTGAPQTRQDQATGVGRFNATAFLVAQMIGAANHAAMVQVVNVYPPSNPLAGTGTLDVLPLVNQLAGDGTPVPHETVYGLIYARLVGGSSAVVLDPQPGDIGVAVFCDRDISAVKTALGPANPGSFRSSSLSDGMYLLGWGNAAPVQYVQFIEGGGIKVLSPEQITLQAPVIALVGDVQQTGAGTITAHYGTGASVTVDHHQHAQPNDSAGDTEAPTAAPTPGT